MDTKTFNALAEPTRLRIVELLREHPSSVNDIAAQLNLQQSRTSKHLRALKEARMVSVSTVAHQHIYELNQAPFLELNDWVSSFNYYWNARFDRLNSHLKVLKKG